jgi:hypothetical protein
VSGGDGISGREINGGDVVEVKLSIEFEFIRPPIQAVYITLELKPAYPTVAISAISQPFLGVVDLSLLPISLSYQVIC